MKRYRTNDVEGIAESLRNKERFGTTGRLFGYPGYLDLSASRLSDVAQDRYKQHGEDITYVVVSYDTPIYWLHRNTWYGVEEYVSQTTEQHHDVIYEAMCINGEGPTWV